jgi:hypothetical protein
LFDVIAGFEALTIPKPQGSQLQNPKGST